MLNPAAATIYLCLDAPARATVRQEKSRPLLAALKEWLDQAAVNALPKSPLGEAVTFARNQWDALNGYVRDGDLAIDNNRAERAVKPFAIGRNYAQFRIMRSS